MHDVEHGTMAPRPEQGETLHEAEPQRAPWQPPTARRIELRRTLALAGTGIDSAGRTD
ncbi:MAG: hypothetical protein HYU66_13310 [Armatimonadetes bacterium]|nr:hypothetical protein [Armatimonadota bacterium]